MAGEDMANRAARLQRRIEWIDCSARNAEGAIDAFPLQHQHRSIDSTHSCHGGILRISGKKVPDLALGAIINGNQSHSVEINIFKKTGTIAAKRICREATAGCVKLRGAP
jgi:hypothetical protein